MTLHLLPVAPTTEPLRPDYLWPLILLYVGPDQLLPLTSFLAAIVGVILIFWRYVVGLARKVWQLLFRR